HQPDFVVLEIADGIFQRETTLLLADDRFRESIDAVTFVGPDALSCDAGVRRLGEQGYRVLATGGPVANSRLGAAEVGAFCGLACVSGEGVLAGELVPALRAVRDGRSGRLRSRVRATRAAANTPVGVANGRGPSPVAP